MKKRVNKKIFDCLVVLFALGIINFTNGSKTQEVKAKGNMENLTQMNFISEKQKAEAIGEFSKNFQEYLDSNETVVSEELQENIMEGVMEVYDIYTIETVGIEQMTPEEKINEFSKYAVEKGIIEDTPQARAAISKWACRKLMTIVAEGGNALGLKISHDLLLHSLNDAPNDLYYYDGSAVAKAIKSSEKYRILLRDCKNGIKRTSGYTYNKKSTEGIVFDSPKDLAYSLHKMDYAVRASKKSGVWHITVTLWDTYDFDPREWEKLSLGMEAKNALNDAGIIAQSIGAIVPYKIIVTLEEDYRPSYYK